MRNRPTKAQIEAEAKRRGISLDKGFSGISQDINESLESAPEALGQTLKGLPGAINRVGHYATTNNPVNTLANLGAGAVESGAAVLSSPQKLMRYIAEKFPEFGERAAQSGFGGMNFNDPTFHEKLNQFEEEHGLQPKNEEERSVRGAGGILGGAPLLKLLPNMLSRSAVIGAEAGGRGNDPLHAALLGMLGETTGRSRKHVAQVPKAIKNTVRALPELKANISDTLSNAEPYRFNKGEKKSSFLSEHANLALADALESIAEKGAKLHIPGLPEKLLESSYKRRYENINPHELAQKKLFSDISKEDLPQMQERVEAAKRLGLSYLTPAEAVLSPFEAAKQGTIGRTSEGSKLLFQKGKERQGSEATAINNLLDTIYDAKELAPDMKAAYEKTMQNVVPPEFVEKWSQNENVKKAIKEIETEPEYKQELGNTPKNSFEYWDHVKRVLGDIERGHLKPVGTKQFKLASVTKTRNQMVDEMDHIEPAYETARGISERNFTRKDIEKFFDKRKMTGNNFYKLISSKEKFNQLMKKLEAFPEAQQKLKDMQLLFEDLIPNNPSLRTATALKRTSMSEARNKLDAERMALDEQYGRAHDVAAVELMTNPRFLHMLTEFLEKNKGKK